MRTVDYFSGILWRQFECAFGPYNGSGVQLGALTSLIPIHRPRKDGLAWAQPEKPRSACHKHLLRLCFHAIHEGLIVSIYIQIINFAIFLTVQV